MNNEQYDGRTNPPVDQQVLVDALAKALVSVSQEKKEGNAPRPEVRTIDLVELMCSTMAHEFQHLICATAAFETTNLFALRMS